MKHSPIQLMLLAPIWVYRKLLSPLKPKTCRFHPTCSAYTAEAIELHGAAQGSYLGIKRIAKCHPFNPGGYDPVPPKAGVAKQATALNTNVSTEEF